MRTTRGFRRTPTAADVQAFDQQATIQAYLHQAGYQTAIAGKFFNTWPVGQDPPNFDRWAIFGGGYDDPVFNVDGTVRIHPGYSTNILSDLSVDMLQTFESSDATPWFLYLAPQAPHSPFIPDAPYVDAAVPPWKVGPAFNERHIGDKPRWVRWRTFSRAEAQHLRAVQLRTLMSVDDMVQRIFAELDTLDETSDTLAIFTSDNGYLWGEHRIGGEKRFPYSESVEVPFYMRWPGHVAPGEVDDRLVANVDILPTILDATGVDPTLRHPLDGRSALVTSTRRRLLLEYWRSPDSPTVPGWASIRRPGFQYIEWYSDGGSVTFREYYNLVKDPYELRNLLHDGTAGDDPNVSSPVCVARDGPRVRRGRLPLRIRHVVPRGAQPLGKACSLPSPTRHPARRRGRARTRGRTRRRGGVPRAVCSSATVTTRPASSLSDVTPWSGSPHATIPPNHERSVSQLSAKPWSVTRARMSRTPIAHTFRSPDQTPVWMSGRRSSSTPMSAAARITTSSMRRRCAAASGVEPRSTIG